MELVSLKLFTGAAIPTDQEVSWHPIKERIASVRGKTRGFLVCTEANARSNASRFSSNDVVVNSNYQTDGLCLDVAPMR
jgi:hypothetical protein